MAFGGGRVSSGSLKSDVFRSLRGGKKRYMAKATVANSSERKKGRGIDSLQAKCNTVTIDTFLETKLRKYMKNNQQQKGDQLWFS